MRKKENYLNLILAFITGIILWGILALFFDFYYELNDDVLIKDILAGVYTGRPDAHNNQMMYPISFLITMLYGMTKNIPWFGIFEIACFAISFIIICSRLLGIVEGIIQKIILAIFMLVLWLGAYLWELTMIQYTVVCGVLCMAAAIWVYTSDHKDSIKGFVFENVPAIVLAILAFNIRSEMFLLMCPFMAMAGLARWANEPTKKESNSTSYKGILDIINIKKYFCLIGIIIAGILVTVVIDRMAYSKAEWKVYRDFFDARTEVYDFTGIPDYSANEEFYRGEGITESQYQLLVDYNFVLDNQITADKLWAIANYVKSGEAKNADGSPYVRLNKSIKTTLGEYVRGAVRFTVDSSYDLKSPFADEASQLIPMNMIVILLYVTLFMIAYFGRIYRYVIVLPALVMLRSIAWVYIYYKGRLVSRITHPMFFIEIVLLLAMIIYEINLRGREFSNRMKSDASKNTFRHELSTKGYAYLAIVLTTAICILNGINLGKQIQAKQYLRDDINFDVKQLNDYTEKHEGYYLIDVYSTVDFTEKIFSKEIVDKSNQQLAGGWIAKSPLDAEKGSGYSDYYFAQRIDGKWRYESIDR